jgi:hypothetical protein
MFSVAQLLLQTAGHPCFVRRAAITAQPAGLGWLRAVEKRHKFGLDQQRIALVAESRRPCSTFRSSPALLCSSTRSAR